MHYYWERLIVFRDVSSSPHNKNKMKSNGIGQNKQKTSKYQSSKCEIIVPRGTGRLPEVFISQIQISYFFVA